MDARVQCSGPRDARHDGQSGGSMNRRPGESGAVAFVVAGGVEHAVASIRFEIELGCWIERG